MLDRSTFTYRVSIIIISYYNRSSLAYLTAHIWREHDLWVVYIAGLGSRVLSHYLSVSATSLPPIIPTGLPCLPLR